jgi:hypothetical protein
MMDDDDDEYALLRETLEDWERKGLVISCLADRDGRMQTLYKRGAGRHRRRLARTGHVPLASA